MTRSIRPNRRCSSGRKCRPGPTRRSPAPPAVSPGPEIVKPGAAVTYTLTVKNNGPGNSSGYTVTDTVPAPLTNVKTS
ncbi:hypothetical protein [Kitasatospora sp. NPDC088351]|uniref:hypothetical protein n=1 Tax=Kitasatospora sp. NPDC088351 TaxID=3155180 RepID=UPI003424EEDC